MNTYIYGPAADEHTGAEWRQPYRNADRELLVHAVEVAHAGGIEAIWRVSPLAPLDQRHAIVASDPAEQSTLIERCREVLALGFDGVLVAFDDASAPVTAADRDRYADSPHPAAAAHAGLANTISDALGGLVTVCPTEYWGTADTIYSRELHRLLKPGIAMCWTGPQVVSARISAKDVADIRDRCGSRPIWLWDNYPVNDWGALAELPDRAAAPPRMMAGPIRGRDQQVASLDAYLINGSSSAAVTALVLSCAAAFARDPAGYQPDLAWDEALLECAHGDPRGAETLRIVTDQFSVSPLQPVSASELARACWRLLLTLDSEPAEANQLAAAANPVARQAAQILDAVQSLRQSSYEPLAWVASDLGDWICAIERLAQQLIQACSVIAAHANPDACALPQAAADLMALRRRAGAVGATVMPWAHAVIEHASVIGGTSAPTIRW